MNRFRSWGEAQVGRFLERSGIAYLYEHPVAVVDRGKTRIWYPDFQLAGYGMLLEYCGRMDDAAYAEGVAKKRSVYTDNGISALMIMPDDLAGNWPERLAARIEGVLVERVTRLGDGGGARCWGD